MPGYPEWQDPDDSGNVADEIVDVLDRNEVILKPPSLYAVVFLNDDFTHVGFVIAMLMAYFQKSEQEAAIITQHIHEKGKGVAGIYTHDVATTKMIMVCEIAQQEGFPLKLIVEAQ